MAEWMMLVLAFALSVLVAVLAAVGAAYLARRDAASCPSALWSP